jgi:thiamine-phosphate diphosphorylase
VIVIRLPKERLDYSPFILAAKEFFARHEMVCQIQITVWDKPYVSLEPIDSKPISILFSEHNVSINIKHEVDYCLTYIDHIDESKLYCPDRLALNGVVHIASNSKQKGELSELGVINGEPLQLVLNGYPCRDFRQEEHLSCLLVALSCQFSIQDAVILSRSIFSVPRETWPTSVEQLPALKNGQYRQESLKNSEDRNVNAFVKVAPSNFTLYPVVDSVTWIERMLKIGIKTVQLRVKHAAIVDVEQQICEAIRLGRAYQAQVFINDYWQLAMKHGAFGIHLGQEDLLTADVHSIREAGVCLGISTHGYYEILKAVSIDPSYIALGHIFPTTTKQMPSKPQGIGKLTHFQRLIDSIAIESHQVLPTVAIGGIDLFNASQVLATGVSSLAVVRAITLSDHVEEVCAKFQLLFDEMKEGKHDNTQ